MGVKKEKVTGVAYCNRGYDPENNLDPRIEKEPERNAIETKRNVADKCLRTGDASSRENKEEPSLHSADNNKGQEPPTKAKGEEDEDELPDGGWGWIVAFGGFLGQMMVNTVTPCFGILYSKFLLSLGTSAIFSFWIFNLLGFTMTLSGIFINALVEEFGFRSTAFLGIFMMFTGVVTTAFAESPWILLIFISFVNGAGTGIVACLTYSIVPHYFKKRLGIANAIMSSGVSAGQIIGPVLITQLQNEFAHKGAIIILSGFILHGCVGATVLHPREWHLKTPRVEPKKLDSAGGLQLVLRILKNTLKNLTLMKSPVALIVAAGGTFNVIGYLNFLNIMPFAMQEAGFSVEDAAAGVTVSGITNLATRLLVSVLADFPRFNMRLAYMFGTLLTVTLSVVFCFLNDLTSIQIVMGLWGMGVGTYMGLFNLVMVKYVGRERLMAQIGLTSYVSSFWFLSCGPLIGAIRDVSGSYTASICTLAGSIFITFLLYLCLPAAIAYDERRAKRDRQQEISKTMNDKSLISSQT